MHDPIRDLEQRTTPSATVYTDRDGYDRVAFAPDELERLERYLVDEIFKARVDDQARVERVLANVRAYEALPDEDQKGMLVFPICKRDANQHVAYQVQTIMAKDPVISTEAIDGGTVDVLGVDDSGPYTRSISSEEAAKKIERFVDYAMKDLVPLRKVLNAGFLDAIIGPDPAYLKVHRVEDVKKMKKRSVRQADGGGLSIGLRPEEVEVPASYPNQISYVPALDTLMPAECINEQESPWFAELLPNLSPTDVRMRFRSGQWDFAAPPESKPDLEKIDYIVTGASSNESDYRDELRAMEGRIPADPSERSLIYEIWMRWPLLVEKAGGTVVDEETGEEVPGESMMDIEVHDLVIHFHYGRGTILMAKVHPYWFPERPYVPLRQRIRHQQHSGGSVVEDLRPLQKMLTGLMHIQMLSGAQNVLKMFLVRRKSTAAASLEAKMARGGLRPGDAIEFDTPDEITPFQGGGAVATLANEVAFINNEATRLSGVSEIDRGDVPNRTAAAAIEKVLEQSKLQSSMTLDNFREQISKAVTMWIMLVQQYSSRGEMLPYRDETTKKLISDVIFFPLEPVANKFRFRVTASSADQVREMEYQRRVAQYKLLQENNAYLTNALGALTDPKLPEFYERITSWLIARDQKAFGDILSVYDPDWDQVVLTPKMLTSILAEKRQALREMQQQAAMAQQGAPQGGMGGAQIPNQAAAASGAAPVPVGIGDGAAPQGGPAEPMVP